MLAVGGAHSTVAAITNPTAPPAQWRVAGVPLCRLMRAERRAGRDRQGWLYTPSMQCHIHHTTLTVLVPV
jgi:hypothetical protein